MIILDILKANPPLQNNLIHKSSLELRFDLILRDWSKSIGWGGPEHL